MPRSSRHKKQHKHSSRDFKERSDSEGEEISKERKVKEDPEIRVSRDSDLAGKRKSPSQPRHGKDPPSGDYGSSKRRKDRAGSPVAADRWNGGGNERDEGSFGEKAGEGEGLGAELEKVQKSKASADSKSRSSSRRHEISSERKEEAFVAESDSKRKSEKDSSWKEAHQGKEVNERGIERDRKVEDARRERSVDVTTGTADGSSEVNRKRERKMEGLDEEQKAKQEVEITEWQMQDEVRNPELEKELEKRIRRRRDGSDDRDKKQEDNRDGDDTKLSSRDDRIKNGRYKDERHKDARYSEHRDERHRDERHKDGRYSEYRDERHKDGRYSEYKDERHKDGRYSDKYREDPDKDHRYRDDKLREEHSSRDRTSKRSDSKHFRDENKPSENRHKKTKPQDSDHDGSPYVDDRSIGNKDSRGRKRLSDDNEDHHSDLKSHSTKEHRIDVEKNALRSSRVDSHSERGRSESHYRHSDVADSASNSRLKSSPGSNAPIVKDQSRHGSKQVDSTYRDSLSKERMPDTASTRELASVIREPERVYEPHSMEKPKQKDDIHLDELPLKNAATSQSERSPNLDNEASPIRLREKSPSSTSGDRRHSGRSVRRSLDVEEIGRKSSGSMDVEETGRKSISSKDGRDNSVSDDRGRELHLDKPAIDEFSPELLSNEPPTLGSSSFNRTGQLHSNSASLLPPPPPSSFRHGIESPSVLGSLEDDARGQTSDRKAGSRYKRTGDPNMGRAQGNAWKGVANWPSSVTNGFIPFQHGPPPAFHAMVQQFPTAPLFGVRPSMELSHAGVSYHMHDTAGHARPYGWRNPVDDHLHGWDGTNGVFGDESNIYGRPDWDQSRHLMSSRGWEMSADPWKGQNGSINMEFQAPQKEQDNSARILADETWNGQSSQRSRSERNRPEHLPAISTPIKQFDGLASAKDSIEAPPEFVHKKTTETSKLSTDSSAPFYRIYLSKLDISVDLAHPDCLRLLEMEGETTDEINSNAFLEEDTKVGGKSLDHSLRDSLFPAITETVFQRSMALYKKQMEERNVKICTSSSLESNLEEVTPASDEEKAESAEEKAESAEEKTEAVEDHSLVAGHASPAISSPIDEEQRNGTSNSDSDFSLDANKQQSDAVSGSIVLADDGSQGCEALMPESVECRENLSRIHNSPESTH
ncbi:uncharacterized protein LOC131245163 [Magnolia sinica]|uniref:uncharacterized protein LOC131245163 n=1 Tax=Magnolia sinica TaxID=86752 RepID=UPI0026580E69|nr:uncharacterized protein LOC131245163 [Magnolia sinica]